MDGRYREDMTDNNEQETKRPLSLAKPGGRLELKKPAESAQVRQSFSHGRSKAVTVEVKKKRVVDPVAPARLAAAPAGSPQTAAPSTGAPPTGASPTLPPAAQRPDDAASVQSAPARLDSVNEAAPVAIPAAPPQIVAVEPPAVSPEPVSVPAASEPTQDALTSVASNEDSSVPAHEPEAPATTAAEPPPVKPTTQGPRMVAPPPANYKPTGTSRPGQGQAGKSGGQQTSGNNRATQKNPTPPSNPGTLRRGPQPGRTLTEEERLARVKALQGMIRADEQAKRQAEVDTMRKAREEIERMRQEEEAARRKAEEDAKRRAEEEAKRKAEEEAKRKAEEEAKRAKSKATSAKPVPPAAAPTVEEEPTAERTTKPASTKGAPPQGAKTKVLGDLDADDTPKRGGAGVRAAPRKPAVAAPAKVDQRRRTGKMTISRALSDDEGDRVRSLASVRRARERERLRLMQQAEQVKVVRDVVIPESITVQELAQRMAERGTDVVKTLMRMGVMATLNQAIDADTAELVVTEFGHNLKRVADADVEIGLKLDDAPDTILLSRPPVVTIMGHVDHGKTSLLDALRSTDVASGEAGGITQHIGAYQVALKNDRKITFIDTPGHQAFTAMRARGANVTDIVVLVVAADDGIKDQTIEAIRHAKAANAPIVVAINKCDKPGADPNRVRQELLQHDIVVEAMSGDVLDVEVSALKRTNLDKLEEAILLQAELLDLKANPMREAEGVIIEAKLERGRGPVATVLVQRGTLKVGDIFVAGGEWGRVRALLDDKGQQVKEATPGQPVEVLGLNGTPLAGDDFSVVDSESRARDITEFRQRRKREAVHVAGARGTLEEMFAQIASGTAKELPVVVKSDVQGSLEAILASLRGLGTPEVAVRILHSGVGGISESDITLGRASNAVVIGFNVRANPQARDLARRDNVEIRYYSIIYDVIDDIKKILEGMLSPTLREAFLGNAEIREVYEITKTGKVAGCYVTEGVVRRGAKVRLLRDNVVIHEGTLKTLRRFKDDVKEVKDNYECGMAFENYSDIQVGDIIECFDVEAVARVL